MEEGARRATADDIGVIADLAREAIAELSTSRGGTVWARREARQEPIEESLRAVLDGDDHLLAVGVIDGTVVGYTALHLETLADGAILGVIDDLFTVPGARGVGVGEAMADIALTWCRERGCAGVDALALPGERATKNFFESLGLVARAIVVHRAL